MVAMEVAVRSALKSQYRAALATLREATERCPDELWIAEGPMPPFWLVVYHTLFYTQLYLSQNEEDFKPWPKYRENIQFMESTLPWPPHERVELGEPFSKAEIYEFFDLVESQVEPCVDGMDLERKDSGFYWYKMPKLDHTILNIRHIMNHAGQLDARLRLAACEAVAWHSGR
jgi:hypothetical protein